MKDGLQETVEMKESTYGYFWDSESGEQKCYQKEDKGEDGRGVEKKGREDERKKKRGKEREVKLEGSKREEKGDVHFGPDFMCDLGTLIYILRFHDPHQYRKVR